MPSPSVTVSTSTPLQVQKGHGLSFIVVILIVFPDLAKTASRPNALQQKLLLAAVSLLPHHRFRLAALATPGGARPFIKGHPNGKHRRCCGHHSKASHLCHPILIEMIA
jgi:hypothetical protein